MRSYFKGTCLSAGYTYSVLDAHEIRLLCPQHSPGENDLSFDVRHFPRSRAPPYTAVSYTWGEGAAGEKISLNGHDFLIRQNLWVCLHSLASYATKNDAPWKFIWVDAICIDQSDDSERNAQVLLMDETYKNAECVSVWLDFMPESLNSFASSSHHRVLRQSSTPASTTKDEQAIDKQATEKQAINDQSIDEQRLIPTIIGELTNHPYWSRVWVIHSRTTSTITSYPGARVWALPSRCSPRDTPIETHHTHSRFWSCSCITIGRAVATLGTASFPCSDSFRQMSGNRCRNSFQTTP
jgi:hypothetical protein